MQFYKSLRDFKKSSKLGVCIGNFDGMHLGHQALFSSLEKEELDQKIFLTFTPHPKKVINKLGADFEEITPLRQKVKLADKYGFDGFLALKFSKKLQSLSARDFVKQILVDGLGVSFVVVGYDWRFGKAREGDLEKLKALGLEFGFRVIGVQKFEAKGERVSSSQVRKALIEGNMTLVKELLGRDFSVGAKVINGDQRGRLLGFPTANMLPKAQLLPARGVYCSVAKFNGKELKAVSNIGVRPTFSSNKVVLETHILDHSDLNLYGECLEIIFYKRLRKEKKFTSKDALIEQIKVDCEQAKKYFAQEKQ